MMFGRRIYDPAIYSTPPKTYSRKPSFNAENQKTKTSGLPKKKPEIINSSFDSCDPICAISAKADLSDFCKEFSKLLTKSNCKEQTAQFERSVDDESDSDILKIPEPLKFRVAQKSNEKIRAPSKSTAGSAIPPDILKKSMVNNDLAFNSYRKVGRCQYVDSSTEDESEGNDNEIYSPPLPLLARISKDGDISKKEGSCLGKSEEKNCLLKEQISFHTPREKHKSVPITTSKNSFQTPQHCLSSDDSSDEKFELFLSEVKSQSKRRPVSDSPIRKFICDSSDDSNASSDESSIEEINLYHRKITNEECRPNLNLKPREGITPQPKAASSPSIPCHRCLPIPDSSLFLKSLSSKAEDNIHADAKVFLKCFKSKKQELAVKLYSIFNTEVFLSKLPSDMSIKWNPRMTKTAGFCYYMMNSRDKTRSARIELSSKVIDKADRLRDVLLHEMCHAAAWIVNNYKNGHGPVWKRWGAKANKTFPDLPVIERCHNYDIFYKYTYKCVKCSYRINRHSKSIDTTKKGCGYCKGRFELVTNSNNSQSKPVQGFALYVKENYGQMKSSNKELKHSEIMKMLSSQFAKCKVST